MHEMSIAESILQVIEESAQRAAARRVSRVVVEIGALSTVVPDALTFCFDAVTRGSIAEGAQLQVIELPGQGYCMDCQQAVALNTAFDLCPSCGSGTVQLIQGNEMRIKEMQVDGMG